jgi:hypothetical protein
MNQDGSPAQSETPVDAVATPAAPETPDYSSPNDLDFEMTPEQEQEYVDQILKDGSYTPSAPDKPVEVAPDKPADPPEAPVAPVEPEKPAPSTTDEITAPQTDDLWIEVEQTIIDDLGEVTTKTVKLVYDPNDPSSFIPEDFKAKNDRQIADILEAKAEMAGLYKERQSEFDKAEATKGVVQEQKALLDSWDAEIKDLIDSGLMEAPKLKPGDEGFDKDPSTLKTDAVFQYMTDQNNERIKNGIAPIKSFGLAFTMYENSEAVKAAAAAEKKENEDTKAKGALIGGSSAASGGTAEAKGYKSGSYNNIWSVPVED